MAKTARKHARIAKKWRNYGKNCKNGPAHRWHSSVKCPEDPANRAQRILGNRQAYAAHAKLSRRKKRKGGKKCKTVCTSA